MGKQKIRFLFIFQLMVFLGLVFRLAELQLINGSRNRVLAEENRVRRELLPAGRGILYDRRGKPLVENTPYYYLLGKEKNELLTRDEALSLAAETPEKVRLVIGRTYPFGEALAHYLGYLGEASADEVEFWLHLGPGDLVGRGGIEQVFDDQLRGTKGWEIFEIDAFGQKIRTVGRQPSQSGEDIQLAVDAQLSVVALEAMAGRPGAVVVTEVKTGRVITLVSSPAYDPNKLSGGVDRDDYQRWLTDPDQPFFNRALGGVYQPGSTFKIVTALAGLEEGKITRQTTVEDTGVLTVGDYSYGNWYYSMYGRTEGLLNVVDALKRSNDIFFYKLGEWLGPDLLATWARRAGLGEKTGIELPGEVTGLVPDPDWKRQVKGERWFLGNTYHYAIGQSDLLATPLQINQVMAAIANNGWLCRPILTLTESPDCRSLGLQSTTLNLVKEGLEKACAPGGTATLLFDFEPPVACKTGTAQYSANIEETHGWLTAYAPANDPQIAVTALIEASEKGSSDAVPVVKKVLEKWFELERNETVVN